MQAAQPDPPPDRDHAEAWRAEALLPTGNACGRLHQAPAEAAGTHGFQEKNVAIVIPLKESCAFSFFKGVLLKDPKHILERIGDHTQAARWIKFTSFREIA